MKRLLLLSDFHQKISLLPALDTFLSKNKIDGICFLGDLTNRNPNALSYAEDFFNVCSRHRLPLFYVHGNNEPKEVIDFFYNQNVSVHLKAKDFYGHRIIGIGSWGEDYNPAIAGLIKDSIFLTHIPPRNSAVSGFDNLPKVHIFGHLHSKEFAQKINGIKLICVGGSISRGRCGLLDLPKMDTRFVSLSAKL